MGVYFYSVEPIGPFPGKGHLESRLYINQAGVITGTLTTPQGAFHAAAVHDGTLTDLTPGSSYASGRGSNHATSQVVAGRDDDQKATVWIGGPNPTDLSAMLGEGASEANDINDGGTVCGTAGGHAFTVDLTSNEVVHPLIPSADWSQAEAINLVGDVVGRGFLNLTDFWSPAFFYSPRYGVVSLWKPGFFGDSAWDVNDSGAVVGQAKTVDDFYFPFRYNGTIERLGGDLHGSAEGINGQGDIVGYVYSGNATHAVLYELGQDPPVDLNSRIPPDSGWFLEKAQKINDEGLIVGWGKYGGGARPFLLRPLDDVPPWGQDWKLNIEVFVKEILFGGGGFGILLPSGRRIYPKGPPVDPGGPFKRLNAAQRDVVVGLAVQVLASHIADPEARRLAEIGGLEAVRAAVDRLLRARDRGTQQGGYSA